MRRFRYSRAPQNSNQSKHRAVSGAESTYGGQNFDWDGTHRHHTSHSKQDRWPARPHKRTAAQKHALRPLCATRAEHLRSAPNCRERARALHARAPDQRADHTRCSRCPRRCVPCSWTRRCARALSCDRGSTRSVVASQSVQKVCEEWVAAHLLSLHADVDLGATRGQRV